jgi:hypothetical protein
VFATVLGGCLDKEAGTWFHFAYADFFVVGMLADDSPCFYGGGFMFNGLVVCVGLNFVSNRCITPGK